jgi:tetratricopeptide (TPR) repeat protein
MNVKFEYLRTASPQREYSKIGKTVLFRLAVFITAASFAWGQAIEQAKRAFDRGDYPAALALFEQARGTSPSCELSFYIGITHYRLNQPGEALIAFRSAVECDPKLIDAHLAMAAVYSERRNDAEALRGYERVLALDGRNTAALSGAANIFLKNNANDKATGLLERLVAVAPNDADAHADLGAALAASGDREKAQRQFEAALRLQPKHASALVGLGNLKLKNGEEERAIELLRAAGEAAPRAFEPRFLLGSAYNRLGRFVDASAELEAAVRLGADESEVYYHLARAYGGLGRTEDRARALARFAELTRKQKEDTEAQRRAMRLLEQAKTLVAAGDLQTAAARLEEARELRPSDDRILFRLASLEYDLKRYDRAEAYTQEALALAPSEWLNHYLAGLVAKASGKWTQARESLETAARLNASAAEVQNALGEVALHEGDRERAVACFRRAVALDVNERAYKLNLDAALKR